MKTLILTALLTCTIFLGYGQNPFAEGSSFEAPPAGGYKTGDQACFTLSIGTSTTALNYAPANGRELYFELTVSNLKDVTLTPDTQDGSSTNYFSIGTTVHPQPFQDLIPITQIATIPGQTWNTWRVCGTVVGTPPGVGGNISYSTNMDEGAYNNTIPTDDEPFSSVQAALPVTLTRFSAAREGSSTSLTWSTTEETNSDFFEVQHSMNAKNWSVLGSVKSHGESTVLRNYSYPHTSPSNGINYYRLRMVDKDQTYAYSTIRSATFDGLAESAVSVFPNPASDRLFINNAEINKLKTLTIVGQDGKELITSPVSVSGVSIKSLQPGLYLVKLLSADGALSTHKLIISK